MAADARKKGTWALLARASGRACVMWLALLARVLRAARANAARARSLIYEGLPRNSTAVHCAP